MQLNEEEKNNAPPPWLKGVVEEVQHSIDKMSSRNTKRSIKRMKKVNKLPPNYYHKNYVKEMHRQMMASVEEE